MKLRYSSLILVIASMALTAFVRAEDLSIKEKQWRADQKNYMDEEVKSTNETCGTKLTEEVNFGTFKVEDRSNHSVYGYCGAPLEALRTLCGDVTGKEAVQKKMKKIVCSFGGTGKRSLSVKDGVATYVVDWDSSNDADYAKGILENAL